MVLASTHTATALSTKGSGSKDGDTARAVSSGGIRAVILDHCHHRVLSWSDVSVIREKRVQWNTFFVISKCLFGHCVSLFVCIHQREWHDVQGRVRGRPSPRLWGPGRCRQEPVGVRGWDLANNGHWVVIICYVAAFAFFLSA